MSPVRPRLLVIASLLSLIPAVAMAEVYKWVDEDGVTHYSQQPPPSGTPTVITPDAAPPTDTAERQGGDGEGEDGNADNENGDAEQEMIADFCNDLRDREKILQGDRPIRVKAEDGTLTTLDDEGRAQRLERVQGQLRDHCKGLDGQSGA
ncbi:DUF4124 domain-containing protein [Halofilum ochraceum]|uniref:DUF4124 domain-containing protein n=1 Tax=Halofilum ochraceum TaxID=1611323 RepID=UPI00083240B8|nr:DUF4124 domain-containing protein [Halofilum ochraceum]